FAPALRPLLTVAVGTTGPDAIDHTAEFDVLDARPHGAAQVRTPGREQARVQAAVRRQSRTGAVAAERLGHRADEADLARAVLKLPAFGDLAAVARLDRPDRPALADALDQLRRGHQ